METTRQQTEHQPVERNYRLDVSTGETRIEDPVTGEPLVDATVPTPWEGPEPFESRSVRRARQDAEAAEAGGPLRLRSTKTKPAQDRVERVEQQIAKAEAQLADAEAQLAEHDRGWADAVASGSGGRVSQAEDQRGEAAARCTRLRETLRALDVARKDACKRLKAAQKREPSEDELDALTEECLGALTDTRESLEAYRGARKRLQAARQDVHRLLGKDHPYFAELALAMPNLEQIGVRADAFLDSPLTQPWRLIQ